MCVGFSSNLPQCSWFSTTENKCGYYMPDSWCDCVGFNNCGIYKEEQKGLKMDKENKVKVIDGVGEDAEIVTNAAGGKQSKSPMAMHLVDPRFLTEFARNKANELEYCDEGDNTCVDDEDVEIHGCYRAIEYIAQYMQTGIEFSLQMAMDSLNSEEIQQVINIAKILQYGADRYAPNNWRLIPEEEHINHALIHIIAHIAGDRQDDHINHALCRLMMAYATKPSEKFAYGAYVA